MSLLTLIIFVMNEKSKEIEMDKFTEDTLMMTFSFEPDETPLLVVGRVEENNTIRVINIIDDGEEVFKLYKKLTMPTGKEPECDLADCKHNHDGKCSKQWATEDGSCYE